jgi:DNA-binding FrmR family transcriptional regulator
MNIIHKSHSEITKRLRRAEGHLKKIIAMIEDNRNCLEIAQQMQAVESAICSAKKTLIHDHLDHCLEEAVGNIPREGRAVIDEFKEITKYL